MRPAQQAHSSNQRRTSSRQARIIQRSTSLVKEDTFSPAQQPLHPEEQLEERTGSRRADSSEYHLQVRRLQEHTTDREQDPKPHLRNGLQGAGRSRPEKQEQARK